MIKKKALTLIELILALLLLSGILLAVSGSTLFFVTQIKANLEKSEILNQINYFLEDAKLRCVSATELSGYFIVPSPAADVEMNQLIFRGEANIYQVTPDIVSDNAWYKYYVNAGGNLVLRTCGTTLLGGPNCATGSEEVMVEAKFVPTVNFIYEISSSPALLKVRVTAENKNFPLGSTIEADKAYPYSRITKEAGIRFWFIDIVQ